MVLNQENCAKLNALVRVMRRQKVTKADVMGMFNTNERTARDMLREIALRCPVISVSNEQGYRIVNWSNPEDVKDGKHTYNENLKRAVETIKRNYPYAARLGRDLLHDVENALADYKKVSEEVSG